MDDKEIRLERRQGKAAVGHRGVIGPKFARTKDRGNMSCKSGANAVVALVNRSISSGSRSSGMRRESRRDDEKSALLLHNNSRSNRSSLAKPGSGHDLKMQQQLRQEGRMLPGDQHLLLEQQQQQQQGDFQKGTFSSGGPQSSRKRPSTAAGPIVPRESMDHVITSLKQKLEQLTTKFVIMQEQSAAAAAEEAQSIARMHEILESKDREIASLRDQLAHLKTDMVVLKEKSVAAKSWSDGSTTTINPTGCYKDDDTAPSPKILLYATSAVKEATNSFAKTFIQKMIQIPDLNNRKTLEDRIRKESGDVLLSSENHSKFLVQAFICRRLYEGFENESFNIESCMSWDVDRQQYTQACFNQFQLYRRSMNTVSILINNEPHDNFLRQFCFQKFQAIVDEHTELLLFGNTQHSAKINRHKRHPCTEFYQSFCKLAVAVWLVHRLAFSFDCPARIFRARKGQAFQASFMTSVVPWNMEDEEASSSSSSTSSVVGVMVLPGFRISKSIIETQVYLEHNHT